MQRRSLVMVLAVAVAAVGGAAQPAIAQNRLALYIADAGAPDSCINCSAISDSIGQPTDGLYGPVVQAPAPVPAERLPSETIGSSCAADQCCGPSSDNCGSDRRGWPLVAEECPPHVLIGLLSYDSFRGIQDGAWQNNGVVAGFNFGTRLGLLSELTGIGFQIGATVGAFNWSGTDYRFVNQDSAQTQGFFTFGFFRHAFETSRWTAALVQDTMYNNNFGEFGQNPMLVQMRGWLGYCTDAWNEFGIWGTWRGWGDTINIPTVGPTTWQPVQQLNAFWHHKWEAYGADTWFWVGRPEQSRLTRDGSLGDYLAGASANIPISQRIAIFALATYMHPSAAAGPAGAEENAWNFTIGFAFYPKPVARATTVAGRRWAPFLPVANNGYFLVDTNRTF